MSNGMNPSYAEVQAALNGADFTGMPEVSVSVLRNIMVESGGPLYQYHGLQAGLNLSISYGEYDNIFQEAVGGSDILSSDTDVCLVFMVLETLSWELAREFTSLSPERVREEVDRVLSHVQSVVAGIRKQSQAMIVWHGFEMPVTPAYGVYDSQTEGGQLATVAELNMRVRGVLAGVQNAYYLDMNLCLARKGAQSFYDLRYWHMGRAPYSLEGMGEIVQEGMKFVRALKGKNRKCLVLDCDNTLWGGIIGEDGLPGIKLGKDYPGSCFYEFQQEVVSLAERGVIIALCSKNNVADVWEVFEKHPGMLLKESHIAAAQINWEDKATNLRRIADDLNIGLDSMVFMDDSEFEIGLIRQELPQVAAVRMPKATPSGYRAILASLGLFDTLTVTGEDRKRGAMYKAEASRRQLKAEITDMEAYYKSLEMVVEIHKADEFAVPRIAQQTQKTNQFNLTTRRYSEADIQAFVDSEEHDVIFLKLVDKFGDSGIVGTCILAYGGGDARVDSLLVSCRVLGRKVEDVFWVHILRLARARGASRILGEYIPTRKNAQVQCFYSDRGLKKMREEGEGRLFYYDLAGELPEPPSFFKEIVSTVEI